MVLLLFSPRLFRVFKKRKLEVSENDEEKRSKICKGIIYEDEPLWQKILKVVRKIKTTIKESKKGE
jgi:hypothetical protein